MWYHNRRGNPKNGTCFASNEIPLSTCMYMYTLFSPRWIFFKNFRVCPDVLRDPGILLILKILQAIQNSCLGEYNITQYLVLLSRYRFRSVHWQCIYPSDYFFHAIPTRFARSLSSFTHKLFMMIAESFAFYLWNLFKIFICTKNVLSLNMTYTYIKS